MDRNDQSHSGNSAADRPAPEPPAQEPPTQQHAGQQQPAEEHPTPGPPAPERPADVLRDGSLKASLWRNEGDKGPFYVTEFSRTYTDADGNYRDSHSFVGADLLKLSELARKAYDRTNELRREEFRQERQTRETRNPGRDR